MALANDIGAPLRHADRFFIGGEWVQPSSDSMIDVIDSATEELFFSVAEAQAADMARAVGAARQAFDEGPWPRMTHAERAEYLRAIAARPAGAGRGPRPDLAARVRCAARHRQGHRRRCGGSVRVLRRAGRHVPLRGAGAADVPAASSGSSSASRSGWSGAIIPWNAPLGLITYKIAPALLAGCTVVLKSSPEAPGEGYVVAEVAEAVGLPPGVLNVVTADREVSELLVRDPRVDKITFTGSTAAGRRIASLCGERIARCTLELGGKSAAVILDDMDLATAAGTLARAECFLSGQVCSSLTRIVVSQRRHDELVEALAGTLLPGPGRRPVRRTDPDGPAGRRAPARPGRGLHRQGRRGGSHARHRRADGRSTSIGAGSSSRPSSATSTTPRRSPRRRSSGRCSA